MHPMPHDIVQDSAPRRRAFVPCLLAVSFCWCAACPAEEVAYRHTDKYGRVIFSDQKTHGGKPGQPMEHTWKGWEDRPLPGGAAAQAAPFSWKQNQKEFDPIIRRLAARHGVPVALVHAVIATESSYDPNAVSRAGAVGLMQLMPETARRFGVTDRTNPEQNMRGGVQYLSELLRMFNHDVSLALAAYNAGENAVKRYGNRIPPYKETMRYVRKVMAYHKQYRKTMG